MKLIIAGGRDYYLAQADYARLDELHARQPIAEVAYGGATGADQCGRKWAIDRGIPVRCFPADWNAHDKAAGPMRNAAMAAYADAVALFPGGKGTQSMYNEAKKAGLRIFDFRGGDGGAK